jgi:type I restriction enzyme S subunit
MSKVRDRGWRKRPFRSLCSKLVNGGTPDTGVSAYWNGVTPWVTGADFISNGIGEIRRHVTEAGIRSSATSVVTTGNLLIVTRTGVGKLAIAPFDVAISQDITGAYISPSEADTGFIYYVLQRELVELKKLNQGTSINGIIRADLENHEVQVPSSLYEQRRIAAILTSIDTAIEKTEALIEKYQQIKAGLMHDLFTRGVLPNGQLRPPREQAPELYQETAIGWIPKDFESKTLRDVCLEVGDGVHYSVSRCAEGVPFLFVSCVRNGQILWEDAARISTATYEEISKKSKPFRGMILFTVVGSYGHAAYVPTNDPFGFERNIAYMKPNAAFIDQKFLYYWLTSSCVENQVERLVIGNAQKVLTLGNMGKVLVALPSKNEQKAIVLNLESIDNALLAVQQNLNKLKNQKLGLMQDLLTGKVPVKVGAGETANG